MGRRDNNDRNKLTLFLAVIGTVLFFAPFIVPPNFALVNPQMIDSCDSLTPVGGYWTMYPGTAVLALDTTTRIQGSGSISLTVNDWDCAIIRRFDSPVDWTNTPYVRFYFMLNDLQYNPCSVSIETSVGFCDFADFEPTAANSWQQFTFDLRTPTTGTVDLSTVYAFEIFWNQAATTELVNGVMHVDFLEVGEDDAASPTPTPTPTITPVPTPTPTLIPSPTPTATPAPTPTPAPTSTPVPTPTPAPTPAPTPVPDPDEFQIQITPSTVTLTSGSVTTFACSILNGVEPFTYRWYLDGVLQSNSADTYTTAAGLSVGHHQLYVVVSDGASDTAQSNTAVIVIEAPTPTATPNPAPVVTEFTFANLLTVLGIGCWGGALGNATLARMGRRKR